MQSNVARRLRVEPAWPLVEAARIKGATAQMLMGKGDLERVRHSAARAALPTSAGPDSDDWRSEDELDLQYWISVCRGL